MIFNRLDPADAQCVRESGRVPVLAYNRREYQAFFAEQPPSIRSKLVYIAQPRDVGGLRPDIVIVLPGGEPPNDEVRKYLTIVAKDARWVSVDRT